MVNKGKISGAEYTRRHNLKRQQKVLDKQISAYRMYYESGFTYEEIAEKLGYKDRTGAWRAVNAATVFVNKERADTVEEIRNQRAAEIMQDIDDLRKKLGKGLQSITRVETPNGKGNKVINHYDEAGELKIHAEITKKERLLADILGIKQDNINITGTITHETVEKVRQDLREQLLKDVVDVEPIDETMDEGRKEEITDQT